MKATRSIRWSLQLWYGLLLATILVGLGLTAYEFESARRTDRVDDELQAMAAQVANSIRPRPGSKTTRNGPVGIRDKNDAPSLPADGPYYYGIWLKNGDPFTASPNAPPDIPPPNDEASGQRTRANYREAWLTPAPGDHILVGRSITPLSTELRRFGGALAGFGVAILITSLLIGNRLVNRALRPLAAITRAAESITSGDDLTRRIDTRETDSELGALARVLNETLHRLEASFGRQARFTADAAHELRTPVSVILTHAQNGLDADDLDEPEREAFAACHRAAQRMRRLIDELLLLARLDSATAPHHQDIDLATLAAETISLLQPIATERGTTIIADLAPTPALGDADRIGQIVLNLLDNALHHGGPASQIDVATRSEGEFAIFEVTDNGPGIPPEHLPHIFERFYRADRSRTNPQGRTGLGLAISKAIATLHQGTLDVRSTPGKATTIKLMLPK